MLCPRLENLLKTTELNIGQWNRMEYGNGSWNGNGRQTVRVTNAGKWITYIGGDVKEIQRIIT